MMGSWPIRILRMLIHHEMCIYQWNSVNVSVLLLDIPVFVGYIVVFHVMASFSIAPGQGLYVVRSLIHLGMVTIAPIAHPIIYGDLHGDSLWQFTISQPVTGPAGKGHCSSRAAFALLQRLCLPFVQGDLRHQHRPFLGTKKRKMWDFRSELVGRMNCMNYRKVIWAAALICVYGKYYSGDPGLSKASYLACKTR